MAVGQPLHGPGHAVVAGHVAFDERHLGAVSDLVQQALRRGRSHRRLIGERQPTAVGQHGPRHRPGDAALVGDAHDEHVLAPEKTGMGDLYTGSAMSCQPSA